MLQIVCLTIHAFGAANFDEVLAKEMTQAARTECDPCGHVFASGFVELRVFPKFYGQTFKWPLPTDDRVDAHHGTG